MFFNLAFCFERVREGGSAPSADVSTRRGQQELFHPPFYIYFRIYRSIVWLTQLEFICIYSKEGKVVNVSLRELRQFEESLGESQVWLWLGKEE